MEHTVELGEFLRACRGRLRPDDVGLPHHRGRRRVSGLRREELAQLAGVSTDYYTRLEQGRNRTASPAVLDALAQALRLDDAGRAHLFDLAGPAFVQPRRDRLSAEKVSPATSRLLDVLDEAYSPAFVYGRRIDVLRANRLWSALVTDSDGRPREGCNFARFVFLDPYAREICPEWARVAGDTAAMLRLASGRHPDDQWLEELVCELRTKSADFRRFWAAHKVYEHTGGIKHYRHPLIGEVTLTYQALAIAGEDDQTMIVYTSEPGSPSDHAIRRLAHLTRAEPVLHRSSVAGRSGV